ncbi:hypothetical protein BpHYR1_028138 [Brachionus plicatilis]|uniref:Uncharacterized protein n=1 Tax=Brachionus plicatilis TaxID=10195 RepID=A0A3M7PP34_BRAPC|nr:hypothetical protein BpHYR1_028138 [Brachionus plicatilis]
MQNVYSKKRLIFQYFPMNTAFIRTKFFSAFDSSIALTLANRKQQRERKLCECLCALSADKTSLLFKRRLAV